MISINFEETYEPLEVAKDLTSMMFVSPLRNGEDALLKVSITPLEDPLLPNVNNLAFGPLNENGLINDRAQMGHCNIGRVFSTILLFCLTFLRNNSSLLIGVDGSNDARAYLYHRMFLTNRDYLRRFFVAIGVDWYVRMLRNGTFERDKDGSLFLKPRPEPFDYQRNTGDLYCYYTFHLAQ